MNYDFLNGLFSDDDMTDVNGDGIPDIPVDTDNDGVYDSFVTPVDLNGDGVYDSFMSPVDTNGDGVYDSYMTPVDVDGDGFSDGYIVPVDLNGDGVLDGFEAHLDTDHDGMEDVLMWGEYRDDDGDGDPDSLDIEVSSNGYHVNITETDTDDDGYFDTFWFDDNGDDDMVMDVGAAPAYDRFDPDDADLGSVVGNPGEAMESWHVQGTDYTCAVVAQEFALEQLTGHDFSEADLADIAEANGWLIQGGGTANDDIGNLLEAAGLRVERSYGNTFQELESCLANGGQVIVSVDSDEMWMGESDDFFLPGHDSDHAIQVIGVDHSDPDGPMVIINDSGVANGCGAMVPLDVFMDAWEDSGCFLVEAYN